MTEDEQMSGTPDDYQEYVRLRSLNRALVNSAPWAGAWMVIGSLTLVAGYLIRPAAELVGVDPQGRAWELNFVDRAGHPVKKGSTGE